MSRPANEQCPVWLAILSGAITLAALVVISVGTPHSADAQFQTDLEKGRWMPISDSVTSQLKCDWPGLTTGVAVDRTNGDLFMAICGQGIWKSSDQGRSFARVDGGLVGGRCETGYALCADPAGRRLCCFMLDGSSGMTLGGKWTALAQVGRGWDYAAVDWTARSPQTIYALQHESGGKRWLSVDAGKSWRMLDEDPAFANASPFGVGVAGRDTLLRWHGGRGIERSADLGQTWSHVSDELPVSHVMVVFEGVCCWLGKNGLVVSKDSGLTWTVQGKPVDAAWGPYFGRDRNQIAAAGPKGIFETSDGGKSWRLVTELPSELKESYQPGWFLNVAFDPVHRIYYASRMGKPTFRYVCP